MGFGSGASSSTDSTDAQMADVQGIFVAVCARQPYQSNQSYSGKQWCAA